MDTEHLELADLPELSTAVKLGPFLDYSVGLSRVRDEKHTFLGSGVLVKKGGRCGILTAHHCLPPAFLKFVLAHLGATNSIWFSDAAIPSWLIHSRW